MLGGKKTAAIFVEMSRGNKGATKEQLGRNGLCVRRDGPFGGMGTSMLPHCYSCTDVPATTPRSHGLGAAFTRGREQSHQLQHVPRSPRSQGGNHWALVALALATILAATLRTAVSAQATEAVPGDAGATGATFFRTAGGDLVLAWTTRDATACSATLTPMSSTPAPPPSPLPPSSSSPAPSSPAYTFVESRRGTRHAFVVAPAVAARLLHASRRVGVELRSLDSDTLLWSGTLVAASPPTGAGVAGADAVQASATPAPSPTGGPRSACSCTRLDLCTEAQAAAISTVCGTANNSGAGGALGTSSVAVVAIIAGLGLVSVFLFGFAFIRMWTLYRIRALQRRLAAGEVPRPRSQPTTTRARSSSAAAHSEGARAVRRGEVQARRDGDNSGSDSGSGSEGEDDEWGGGRRGATAADGGGLTSSPRGSAQQRRSGGSDEELQRGRDRRRASSAAEAPGNEDSGQRESTSSQRRKGKGKGTAGSKAIEVKGKGKDRESDRSRDNKDRPKKKKGSRANQQDGALGHEGEPSSQSLRAQSHGHVANSETGRAGVRAVCIPHSHMCPLLCVRNCFFLLSTCSGPSCTQSWGRRGRRPVTPALHPRRLPTHDPRGDGAADPAARGPAGVQGLRGSSVAPPSQGGGPGHAALGPRGHPQPGWVWGGGCGGQGQVLDAQSTAVQTLAADGSRGGSGVGSWGLRARQGGHGAEVATAAGGRQVFLAREQTPHFIHQPTVLVLDGCARKACCTS